MNLSYCDLLYKYKNHFLSNCSRTTLELMARHTGTRACIELHPCPTVEHLLYNEFMFLQINFEVFINQISYIAGINGNWYEVTDLHTIASVNSNSINELTSSVASTQTLSKRVFFSRLFVHYAVGPN